MNFKLNIAWSSSQEPDYCVQYDYYKNGNSKSRNNFASPTSVATYWERSPLKDTGNGTDYGYCIFYLGNAHWTISTNGWAIAPAFCISRD